jgi:cell division protein ZapE
VSDSKPPEPVGDSNTTEARTFRSSLSPLSAQSSDALNPESSGLSPARWYAEFRKQEGFEPDPAQASAVEHLQALHQALIAFKQRPRGLISRTLSPQRHQPPRGLYLHGGVGRGKSALMDAFYAGLPYRRKRRMHFHPFMREVHAALNHYAHSHSADPLVLVAQDLAKTTRVLCFDEFHVSDIADAMILGRLLEQLFSLGVVLILTSNYPPHQLYPDGLQRERFLPAIALLEKNLDVLCVDGGIDHRMRALDQERVFFMPLDEAAEEGLSVLYQHTTGRTPHSSELSVLGRVLKVKAVSEAAVWFDFAALCEGARSQMDYLYLAERYPLLLLSGVPRMGPDQAAAARRFTWLVDIFYDHHVPIALSAEVELNALYPQGTLSGEFVRTVSRLEEMQSVSWRHAAVHRK